MADTMTYQDFVDRWANSELGERQTYQQHFSDVCRLVGHTTPDGSGVDDKGNAFLFERSLKKDSGGQGFADVSYGGHFAIEYKAPGKYKNLSDAYNQLLQYRENLNNPPLLVVTDIDNWEVHTNFPNTEKKIYTFKHEDIATRSTVQNILRDLFYAPEKLHPNRNTDQVTADAAEVFRLIADNMRNWEADPERIAHFLTKLVFCLFAEDVSLLPVGPKGDTGIFTEIIERTRTNSDQFVKYMHQLFEAMADGGEMMFADIPYFNGALFDDVHVEELSLEALTALEKAAKLNWEAIEPSIFGTLFERSLDPNKRSQLGAHYTSREDILLILEPVLMQPLRREWDMIQLKAQPIREKYDSAKNKRAQTTAQNQLLALREGILNSLRTITVLDPACGSGNFLYVSLQLLMDMEKEVINDTLWLGLQRPIPEVHPRQMYGIEINPIAHALASIVVWIGYIQWRNNNGYGQAFKEPILEALQDNIVCKDAILPPLQTDNARTDRASPVPTEDAGVEWQVVDVIVGNPPFLGGSKIRGELGDEYYEQLTGFYKGRVSGFADLVCYWFEKAREQIEKGNAKRAGLLATNSIRGGANREVLKRIKETGDIFMAWSDREWTLDGAAVRVSMVGFDNGVEHPKILDSFPVKDINGDLSASVDITVAIPLEENANLCHRADEKGGPFDISSKLAEDMLKSINANGYSNSDVVRPYANALDVTRRSRNMWIIDFGDMSQDEAKLYEKPYTYVIEVVKPFRDGVRNERERLNWWLHRRPVPGMRTVLEKHENYVATPAVAKYRLFVRLSSKILPNHALYVFERSDDYFFGVLHSRLHEVWSLRMGTSLEDRPRYTPTTTFETFPFPWSPGDEDVDSSAYQAISQAAKQLNEERSAWLNPSPPKSPPLRKGDLESSPQTVDHTDTAEADRASPVPTGVSGKALKERTLTNLYNALQVYRGLDTMKIKASAGDFAPRLDTLHQALDKAVCDAYGWEHDILGDEEEILRRLLALNLERAEG
jgi:hypothetical protein